MSSKKPPPAPSGGQDELFLSSGDRASVEVERVTSGLELERLASARLAGGGDAAILPRLLDASGVLQDAASAIVDDTFNRCFAFTERPPWNWNFYLFPLWCVGVVVRYCVLFPIRLSFMVLSTIAFLACFTLVHSALPRGPLRARLERNLVHVYAASYVVSWTGVIKYHGPKPTRRPGHVYVANHTSIIDYIILTSVSPFSSIAQQNKGWVGLIQNTAMDAIDCIRFNRTESKDREMVQRRLREHVADSDRLPLLIFPEGTCVNNEYCVMFKRGAFDLGCKVCPIAIKYNKIFAETFWHSRRQSFTQHLMSLMTSWAVVADVWYLEPQEQREGEDGIQFANRVREMICAQAGIKPVPWDGMLKYYRPSPRMCEKRRAEIAQSLAKLLPPEKGGASNTPGKK
jgi:glycerol-3-phosphate O-acyltransferase 3/4